MRERGVRREGELRERLAKVQADFAEFIPPNPLRARAVLDSRGFPTDLELEGEGTPDEIRAALTGAFLSARAEHPTLPREAAQSLLSAIKKASGDPERAAEHIAAEGVSVSDDLGQATVTGLFGDVIGVNAKDSWLNQSRAKDIAVDILSLARRAATASDRFERFTEKENTHG
jgi:hypothetical protein